MALAAPSPPSSPAAGTASSPPRVIRARWPTHLPGRPTIGPRRHRRRQRRGGYRGGRRHRHRDRQRRRHFLCGRGSDTVAGTAAPAEPQHHRCRSPRPGGASADAHPRRREADVHVQRARTCRAPTQRGLRGQQMGAGSPRRSPGDRGGTVWRAGRPAGTRRGELWRARRRHDVHAARRSLRRDPAWRWAAGRNDHPRTGRR